MCWCLARPCAWSRRDRLMREAHEQLVLTLLVGAIALKLVVLLDWADFWNVLFSLSVINRGPQSSTAVISLSSVRNGDQLQATDSAIAFLCSEMAWSESNFLYHSKFPRAAMERVERRHFDFLGRKNVPKIHQFCSLTKQLTHERPHGSMHHCTWDEPWR